ncbi:MAG: M48 family metallopeptidase [Paludibacteraceae bacterium]|nr:M48 family metallopeptidase [Paludibacteraceae bacterium]
MYTTLFWIIIVLLLAEFFLNCYLDKKNREAASWPIPDELKNVYDNEKYEKQQKYFIENNKFASILSTFSLTVMLLMFFLFGFGFVDQIARSITNFDSASNWSYILTGLVFFAILYYADSLITLPFSIYDTFSIEQRYGFNKTTPLLYFKDTVISWIMYAVIGGILLGLLMFIYQKTGSFFWILGWALLTLFSLGAMMFYSSLIVPLFNKQTQLEDGELRDAIQDFCLKVGFQLDNLYVMDSSKRSTKANAYFSGLGKKKRIVLFDTLITTLTTEEIVAVLSHEIGHYKRKHTRKMLFFQIAYFGILFFIMSLFLKNDMTIAQTLYGLDAQHLYEMKGITEGTFWLSIIVFGMIFSPISTFVSVLMHTVSRKNEYEADQFAKDNGLAEPLISALKKLSSSSLSNLTPHPYYIFFHFSHPTLLQRIKALRK